MNPLVRQDAPLLTTDTHACLRYGVVSLEPVWSQQQSLVDLRIVWANDWMLSAYQVNLDVSLVGSYLSDFIGDKKPLLPEFIAQLERTGFADIDVQFPNTQWVHWRLTGFEKGFMAMVEFTDRKPLTPSIDNGDKQVRQTTSPDLSELLQENLELSYFFDLDLELHCITDRNGNFQRVNIAWSTLLGYTEAELLGQNYLELIHPDDTVFALSGTPYLNLQQPTLRKCVRVRKKNGTYIPVEWHWDCVHDRQYISGRELVDSERKQIPGNDELKQRAHQAVTSQEQATLNDPSASILLSEQRFRAIFNLSYQYIGLMRPDGILLEVNETALRAIGQTLADVIGKPFWETYWWKISEDEQQKLKAAIQRAARGEFVQYEVDVWDKDHNRITLDMSIKPIINELGQVILLIPEGRDITKKKRSEIARQESEKRFREIAENVNDAFWIHSTDPFELVYINPAFERVVGYTLEELQKNPDLLLDAIVEEDRYRLQDVFDSYRRGEELTGQYRFREANKMIRWFTIRTFISTDSQGKPLSYIGVASDITSQKEKEQVLQQSLDREKELNKLKSQFVAIASHEFRTPLATIQSSVDLISIYLNREEAIDKVAMRRHLAVIEQEIGAFTSLLTDVLTIGKMDQGKITFNPKLVDVVALSQETIVTHFGDYRDGRIVQLTIKGSPFSMHLDDKLMKHVLVNLLTNAFKFSTGNPELCLLFTEKKLILSVKDHGIGIPREDIPSLFQPFFRAGNAVSVQGTGLGLAISRQFVELHGGYFNVFSEQYQGTTFAVTLPVNAF